MWGGLPRKGQWREPECPGPGVRDQLSHKICWVSIAIGWETATQRILLPPPTLDVQLRAPAHGVRPSGSLKLHGIGAARVVVAFWGAGSSDLSQLWGFQQCQDGGG